MIRFNNQTMENDVISTLGKVITLFISVPDSKSKLEKAYIQLDSKGITEDKFYNKDINRSVLITSLDSYHLVKKENISMPYGSLGENLLIDYNPYHLPSGTQLQIGSTILEISQYCTICNHLSSIDERVPDLLKNDRGIFAKVIKAGEIKKGDTISLLA